MTHHPIYTLKEIVQSYKDKIALNIPHLTIAPGSITGLMGPNGSGKSTLLKLLAFVAPPAKGILLYKGKAEVPFSPQVRFEITLLTQTPYLLSRSVHDNITHGLKIRGKAHHRKNPEVRKQVKAVMDRVGLSFDAFAHRMAHELSGGEAQRVAMAARLILNPRVLLLDEPTASVDVNSATLIRRAALYARKTWGTTIVIASHDREWLQSACDSLFQLYQGKIFPAGSKNIIPGPFIKESRGVFHTLTATGEQHPLRVPAPPNANASALLEADCMAVTVRGSRYEIKSNGKEITGKSHSVEGKILRLMGDKTNGQLIAAIRVNELDFTIRLTRDEVIRENLLPGVRVILTYGLENIEWI